MKFARPAALDDMGATANRVADTMSTLTPET